MTLFLFALLVLGGAALYFMTPEERKRLALKARDRLLAFIQEIRAGRGALDPLHELLLQRTRWPIVAPILIAACVLVWMATLFSNEPAPLWQISWGASYAPRTTNGEWWRLVAYTFVHAGFFHLLGTVGALLSHGVSLERAVGRVTFAGVYFAAGITAGVVALWARPATTFIVGASGAVCGLYGLLVAVAVFGYLRKPRLPWSELTAKRLAVGAALFFLYNLLSDDVPRVCELAGLATGLVSGTVLVQGVV